MQTIILRVKKLAKQMLPIALRQFLRRLANKGALISPVNFGSFRRLAPFDRNFGYGRGQPVDRHYIEGFLARYAPDVRGHVLEVKDNTYTRRYGGAQVARSSILDVSPENPLATHIADLARADVIPENTFDCIILTQTLHLIYDFRTALAHLHRILKPGGVLLLTVPGISQIEQGACRDIWHWSFTRPSTERMLADTFGQGTFEVEVHGNVLSAVSFLMGLSSSELRRDELDTYDPAYPVVITARVRKPTLLINI
jgi:SAM-dependent methyltransferase